MAAREDVQARFRISYSFGPLLLTLPKAGAQTNGLAQEGPVRTSSTILAIARAQLLDPAAPRYRYRWPIAGPRLRSARECSAGSGLRTRPPLCAAPAASPFRPGSGTCPILPRPAPR